MIDESYLSLSEAERSRCREGVDAVITSEKNCCICVSTADCVPILLYDRTHQVIAAVHDGWRGTVKRAVASGTSSDERPLSVRKERTL